jgi:hypothetical protein
MKGRATCPDRAAKFTVPRSRLTAAKTGCSPATIPTGHPAEKAVNDEKIKVRATANGQEMEVVVLTKSANRIEVVIGAGVHSVRCELMPTRNGQAYAGSVMGREIVYERSREQVQKDIDRLNPREYTRR